MTFSSLPLHLPPHLHSHHLETADGEFVDGTISARGPYSGSLA